MIPSGWPEWVPANGDGVRVVDGIPRFVEGSNYAENFGPQWIRFRETQLDSRSGLDITLTRVRRCLGPEIWENLGARQVLECGCGAGRFTEILLERDCFVTSIDISSAVEANAASFPIGPRHRIAQADILKLPFAPRQFDVVFCLGVIQHTPEPERTLAALYEQVKPGGTLVVDHYTFTRASISLRPFYRAVLKRLSHKTSMAFIERAGAVFLPLHAGFKSSRLLSMLLNRISPMITYYRAFPALDAKMQREWALLDTHDALTDWFKHFRSREDIRETLTKLGMQDVWCEYGGNGVEARGRRPA